MRWLSILADTGGASLSLTSRRCAARFFLSFCGWFSGLKPLNQPQNENI
jgi:hypothetical protein